MSSLGTGADITPQEAHDLLHKLITESITVQGALSVGACPGVGAAVIGKVRPAAGGIICVIEREVVAAPQIMFSPSLATRIKYADRRAFPEETIASIAAIPGTPRFLSALVFVFPDNSQVALYELEDGD